jgi:ribonucleotide monophosphatase NagD (HAD superfamily)
MALDAGMPSAVVLTGETTAKTLAAEPPENRPPYVLDRIDRLIPGRLWEEFGWTESGG